MEKVGVQDRLKALLQEHFNSQKRDPFVPGKTRIPLSVPTYGWEEAYEALDSILSTYVTMGKKVKEFEGLFASYLGVKHAVMVNSGSSANLLALSILTNPALPHHLKPGDEVITPAVTWATTVFPIINCGLVPVLADVNLDTFNINIDEVKKAISPRTKAIMPVHLLGNPCQMDELTQIAREHKLFLIEDACESHGAEYQGKKTGAFGDIATFSFFFSHHISTIEGGMVVTDREDLAEMARALRVFGWVRDLKEKDKLARENPDIDPRFLFVNQGYNFRPMEIQGGFGIHQMKKLEGFIQGRRENAAFWSNHFKKYSRYLQAHEERPGTRHVWFGYPLTVKPGAPFKRKELVDFLESRGVETRPVMAGNIAEQPAMKLFKHKKTSALTNSRLIMKNSFFFGNHQGISNQEREAIADYIDEFMADIA